MEQSKHPIDTVVGDLISRVSGEGGSWVLGTAMKDGIAQIEFRHELPPVDDYQAPADYRIHQFHDIDGLAQYCERFALSADAVLFYDESGIQCVLDELPDTEREVMTLKWRYSDEFAWWSSILGKVHPYKDLRKALPMHSQSLREPDLLRSLRDIKYTEQTKYDAEIKEDEATFGVVFKVEGAGETLRKIPRGFSLHLPVFYDDVLEPEMFYDVSVAVEVVMPEKQGDPLGICLVAPGMELARRQRVAKAVDDLRTELGDGWLLVGGTHDQRTRKVGCPDRFRPLEID